MTNNRRLTKQLGFLLLCVVCTQTALNLARPLISYRAIALGGAEVAVGLITSAYALLSLTVALPLGRYTDRTGRTVPVLLAGTVLLAVAPVLLAVSSSLFSVGVAAAVLGFGHIVFMVGGQGFVAAVSADDALDRNFGLFTAAVSAGQMIGPLAAGTLLGDATGSTLLSATGSALLVAAVAALAGVPAASLLWRGSGSRGASTAKSSSETDTPHVKSLLRRPGMPTGLFTSLALLGAVDLLTAYLPLVAEERGITPTVAGVLLAARSAASILSRLSLGALAARWQRRTLIVASCLGAGICLAVVTIPGGGPLVIAGALLLGGFLLGIGQPLTMTAIVRAVPTHARGAALALRLWSNRAGQVALPAMAALVAAPLGASGALLFASAVLCTAAATARTGPDE